MVKITFDPGISEKEIDAALSQQPAQDAFLTDQIKAEQQIAKRKYRKKVITESFIFGVIGLVLLLLGLAMQSSAIGKLAALIGPFFILAGILFGIFRYFGSFTETSKNDPKKMMKAFLDNDGDYGRAFSLVLPSALIGLSVDDFSNTWEKVKEEEIPNEIKFQESIACGLCENHSNGLWAVEKYTLDDDKIQKSGCYLRCTKCNTIFCPSCYLQIEKEGFLNRHRVCPVCKDKLDMSRPIFLPNPELNGGQDVFEIEAEFERLGKVARLTATSKTQYTLVKIEPPNDVWTSSVSDLGDRGKVEKIFRNTAVLLGDDWFLMSAMPGEKTITH